MNLDRYIKQQLLILSKKYDISIVEITTNKNNKIGKCYTVNCNGIIDKDIRHKEQFRTKRELVNYLLCLD